MKAFTHPIVFTANKKRSVRSTMLHVMGALLPGTLLYSVLIDHRVLSSLVIACGFSMICESICLFLRQRPLLANLLDGSTILATWLLVLCLPQSLPIWQLCFGAAVLVTLGKHVFGGLGQNPFNPAMVAYTVLLISFPVTMTSWSSIQASSAVSATTPQSIEIKQWDALSGATSLDRVRQLKRYNTDLSDERREEISEDLQEHLLNSPWSWVAMAWLVGGIYLLIVNVISWHIPISVLATIFFLYTISGIFGISTLLLPSAALLSGAIFLGAFFIATDPVSAATSRPGQLIYGFGIGVFTFVIREFSAYPEGFAFAVLLMNMCVPLIDHVTIRKHDVIDKASNSS